MSAVIQNEYTGNGSTTQYPFTFPYLKTSDIKASLDGVDTTAFTLPNATTLQFNTAPTNGAKIKIFRQTGVDNLTATFYAGSAIKSEDLNDNFTQNLYKTQEIGGRFISNLGGTMTGDLNMGEDTVIKFEGATDNAHETTITVADPTADRTITLPNVTGTVVTTGDTGTVATGMIANDAITNAKIANDQIDSEHYVDGSIDTQHIADAQVTTAKIADNAVTNPKIVTGAIDTGHLASNAVTTAKIAASAVNSTQIAGAAINLSHMNVNSVDSDQYVDGSIDTVHIADQAVTQAKIADDSVGTAELVDGSVDTARLADNSVTLAKMTDSSVGTSEVVDAAVTTAKIADNAVTMAKLASGTLPTDITVASANLVDGTIATADIADNAITSGKIAAGAVDSTDIGSGVIDTVHIGSSQITTAKIADSNITTAKITDANVTTAKIANDAITIGKLGCEQTTISDSDSHIPTSGAVVDYVAAQIAPLGGLEVIATEIAFPNTQPSSGVVISISDAGGVVVNGSGVSTTGRTVGGSTVTINGFPSSLQSKTMAAGVGLMVSSTGSSQTYNYHKLLAKEADVEQLSNDINDFAARYRVGSSNPTSNNDAGDLFFNTGTSKLLVYNATNSAWEEAQSIGNFFISTFSEAFDGSRTQFTLSNAPTNVQQVILSLNGVVQKPGTAFTLSGSTVTLASAPASGTDYFAVVMGSTVNIGTPSNNTVSTAVLQDDSVTNAKIAAGAVGSTELAANGVITSKIADDAVTAAKIGTLTGNVDFNDNAKARFGTGNDLEIYHDGSLGSYIDADNGYLWLRGDSLSTIRLKPVPSEDSIICKPNGAVELFHDNSKKLETTSYGAKATGALRINTDTANSAGDASDFVIKTPSGRWGGMTIRNSDTNNYGATIYFANNATSGTDSYNGYITYNHGNDTLNLGVQSTNKFKLGASALDLHNDNYKLTLGTGQDLEMYHDGSNSTIDNNTGDLTISTTGSGDDIFIQAQDDIRLKPQAGQAGVNILGGGAVELFHNNSKKAFTGSTGFNVDGNCDLVNDNNKLQLGNDGDLGLYHDGSSNHINYSNGNLLMRQGSHSNSECLQFDGNGHLYVPDNEMIYFGSSADLQLKHDGNHSYIKDAGTGQLRIQSNAFSVESSNGVENMIFADENGAVTLYHDNSVKFATNSTGSRTTGYHTQSAPVSWSAYADAQWYTITSGNSIYPFSFNNIAHNIGGHFKNSGTDEGLFVAPVAGVYQFHWNIFVQGLTNSTSTSNTLEMYIRKNGSTISRLHNKKGYGNMGDDQEVINLSVTEQLAANDKIGVIFSAYGATWRIYGGHSTFSGFLVG